MVAYEGLFQSLYDCNELDPFRYHLKFLKNVFVNCLAIEISHGAESKSDRSKRFCNFCKNLSLLNRSVLNCVLILFLSTKF